MNIDKMKDLKRQQHNQFRAQAMRLGEAVAEQLRTLPPCHMQRDPVVEPSLDNLLNAYSPEMFRQGIHEARDFLATRWSADDLLEFENADEFDDDRFIWALACLGTLWMCEKNVEGWLTVETQP